MARKNLDCSECGAEYSIVTKETDDPSFCPFCGDPGTNYISAGGAYDEDEDDSGDVSFDDEEDDE